MWPALRPLSADELRRFLRIDGRHMPTGHERGRLSRPEPARQLRNLQRHLPERRDEVRVELRRTAPSADFVSEQRNNPDRVLRPILLLHVRAITLRNPTGGHPITALMTTTLRIGPSGLVSSTEP